MGSTVENKRAEAHERAEKDRQEYAAQISQYESNVAKARERSEVWRTTLITATPKDYTEWLDKFLLDGGEISHVYDYPISHWDFYVATKDICLTPLVGSFSLCIIVPKGINVDCADSGHITVFHTGERNSSSGIVPCFSDT